MKSKRLLLLVVSLFFGLVVLPVLSFAQSTSVINPIQQQVNIQPQGMDEYIGLIRANQHTGIVDPAAELEARRLTEQKSKQKSGNSMGLEWTSMGPDNVAGRTRALLIDKSNSNLLYAGSVNGGLWRSANGGSSWSPTQVTGTSNIILNVSCITQTPNGTIYVGTGESFVETGGKGKGGLIGHGIFKSTDGLSFTVVPSTKPATDNDTLADWVYVNRLASTSTGRVWAATNKGLRYSDDEGASWTYAQSAGNQLNENTMDIKVGSNGILVACIGSKCYISENGDPASFVNHSIGGTGNLPLPALIGRIEFAIAPSNPDVIYASSAKIAGNLDNIYRSTDKGQTWKVVGPGGSISFNVFNLGSLTASGKGMYANTIAVYPTDPDQVLLGGYDLWRGKKVDEGYFSWEPVSSGSFPSYYPLYLHYSQHAIVFSQTNPSTVYFANDGGMAVSNDGGQTFIQKIKNYATTQCYSVAASHDDKILLGTQGNGVQYIDKNGNTPISGVQVSSGAFGVETGGYQVISFINPKIMFASATNAQSTRSIDYGATFASYYSSAMSLITGSFITPIMLWESFNDAGSLDSIQYVVRDTILPEESFKVRSKNGNYPFWAPNVTGQTLFPFDTIMVQDVIQSKLFLGANGAVWFTKQALDFTIAPTWYKLVLINNTVQTMAYTPDGNTLFVGTQNGYLLRVRNINSWISETDNEVKMDTLKNFNNRAITSIAVNPTFADNVIVTLGNYGNADYVYSSSNALAETPSFLNKQGDLPAMPVYASLMEMSSADRAVIGTEMGIYSTTNLTSANPSWSAETEGMGIIPVYMLKQQSMNWWPIIADADSLVVTNYGVMYAASHGRGAFKCSKFVGISEPAPKPGEGSAKLQIYPNPATDHVVLSYTVSTTSSVVVEVYDFTGRLVDQQTIEAQTPGTHLLNLAVGSYPKGSYLVRMLTGSEQSTAKLIVQ